MARELYLSQTVKNMTGTGQKAQRKAPEFTHGLTDLVILVIGIQTE
jgi:hypothetical protein